MIDSLCSRVMHAYMNNLRIGYIAECEKIPVAEVERIIGKAMAISRFGI